MEVAEKLSCHPDLGYLAVAESNYFVVDRNTAEEMIERKKKEKMVKDLMAMSGNVEEPAMMHRTFALTSSWAVVGHGNLRDFEVIVSIQYSL